MPTGRGGTIDSIKVGLGVDMTQLDKDIGRMGQRLNKEVVVTPKLNAVSGTEISTWLKNLGDQVQRASQKVRVPIAFDEGIARSNFEATIRQVERSIRPIVVPVHFRTEASAVPPQYGGGTVGGTGGGNVPPPPASPRGRRGGPAQPGTGAPPPPQPPPSQPRQPAASIAMEPPEPVSGAQRTAARSRPAPRQAQPIVEKAIGGGYYMGEELIQDVRGRTVRRTRDRSDVEAERRKAEDFMKAQNDAFVMGNFDAIENMFPGMTSAIQSRDPRQVKNAYILAQGSTTKARQRIGKRIGQLSVTNRGDIASWDEASPAAQYPLDFALQSLLGALNVDTRSVLMRAGGLSVAGGGASKGGRAKPARPRDPLMARKELVYVEDLLRTGAAGQEFTHTYETAEGEVKTSRSRITEEGLVATQQELQAEIATFEKAAVTQAGVTGRAVPFAGFTTPPGTPLEEMEQRKATAAAALERETKALEALQTPKKRARRSGEQIQADLRNDFMARRSAFMAGGMGSADATKKLLGMAMFRNLRGMAMGGRSSSLSDLPGVAAMATGVTMVGEQGPEAMVRTKGGGAFIVPNHQLRQFEGMALGGELGSEWDDLLGRFMRRPGGRGVPAGSEWEDLVRQFATESTSAVPLSNRRAGRAGLRILGDFGSANFATRRGLAGEQAFAEGRASHLQTMSSSIQRVYVVNMPTGGFGGSAEGGGETIRGGPRRPRAEADTDTVDATGTPRGRGGGLGPRSSPSGSIAKFKAEDTLEMIQGRLDQVGIDISEALQKSPVRALSVAFGQIAQTAIGGRDVILANAARARALQRQAAGAAGELESAEQRREQALLEMELLTGEEGIGAVRTAGANLTGKLGATFANLAQEFDSQTQRAADIRPIVERRTAAAQEAAKGILTPGQQFRSQAVGLGGIVGGTLLFTAAMNVAQQGLQLVGQVATEAGDRISDFAFTARRVAQELAPAIQQAGFIGREATFAERAAQLGLPAGTDLGALTAFTSRMASAQNLQAQTDLLRGQRSIAGIGGNQPVPGIGVGFGNGLFGSFVNQTPGAVEILSGQVQSVSDSARQIVRTQADVEARQRIASETGATGLMQEAQNLEDSLFGRSGRNDIGALAESIAAPRLETLLTQANEATDDSLKTFNAAVDKFAEFSGDIAPRGRLVRTGDETLLEETRRALTSGQVGASPEVAGRFVNAGVAAVGPGGTALAPQALNRLFQQWLDSALVPSVESMLEGMRPALTASFAAQGRQFALQQQLVPTGAAQQLIAQPFPSRALTGVTAAGTIDPVAAASAAKYEGAITGARGALMEIRDQGLAELRSLGVPQEAIDSVADLGTEIAALNATAQDLELGLEQAQYNEQIRISVRSIGDLVALNQRQAVAIGDQVVGATHLGELQRAQINDGRELTRIQLARSQRELNLQIALSRLRSPGETPEERAVRRREAELLADEQQRELNINRRSAQRGFRIEDIGFGRGLTDAVKQLGLLQQSRAVSIEVRGIQQVLQAKEQLLAVRQAYLDVARDAGIAVRQGTIRIIETLEARIGRLGSAQMNAISEYVDGIVEAWGPLFGYSGGGGGGGQMRQGWAGTRGLAPNMNGASGVSVRSGGGGGSTITVTVNAEMVHGEADEERLARKVARAIHREAALVGVG